MRSGRFITGHFTITGPTVHPMLGLVSRTRHAGAINDLATDSISTIITPSTIIPMSRNKARISLRLCHLIIRYARAVGGIGSHLRRPLITRACIANGRNVGRTRGRCGHLGGGGSHGGL